jgi:hypothetical protein
MDTWRKQPDAERGPSREVETSSTAGEKLQFELEAEEVQTTRIEIPNGKVITEAILFPEKKQTEPLVRVYRGINHLNTDVLRQVSYALRSREEEGDKNIVILEHARDAVELLANEPTHENLLRYVDTVWPDLNDKEIQELERALIRAEDNVLEHGWSLRLELAHNTFEFTGSYYTDVGMTPFISGSTSPDMAVGYGRSAVMVLDLPTSRVEALATSSSGETAIKTAINPNDIVAILVRNQDEPHMDYEHVVAEVKNAIELVDARIEHSHLDGNELNERMRELREQEKEVDAANREKDILSIQERRAKRIMNLINKKPFSDTNILDVMSRDSLDRYSAVKQLIYDNLVDRFVQAGGRKEALTKQFEYDTAYGEDLQRTPLHCDRNKINDKMLLVMKRRVEHEESRDWR